jgi:hypothetical protein
MMLGLDRDGVLRASAELAAQARELLVAVRGPQPRLAEFLDRYIDFNWGFYGITDYWGSL